MNPIQTGFLNEHRGKGLQCFREPRGFRIGPAHGGQLFRCPKKSRRSQPGVLMQASTTFPVLVCGEVLNALTQLTFEPANHPSKKVTNEVRVRPRLFNRKTARPGIVWRAESVGEEDRPSARQRPFSETVNERAHPVCVAEPAPAGCAVLSTAERATWSAAAVIPAHPRPLANSRHDAPVRIDRQRARSRLHAESVARPLEVFTQQFRGRAVRFDAARDHHDLGRLRLSLMLLHAHHFALAVV
jgi:hypothetical protein